MLWMLQIKCWKRLEGSNRILDASEGFKSSPGQGAAAAAAVAAGWALFVEYYREFCVEH